MSIVAAAVAPSALYYYVSDQKARMRRLSLQSNGEYAVVQIAQNVTQNGVTYFPLVYDDGPSSSSNPSLYVMEYSQLWQLNLTTSAEDGAEFVLPPVVQIWVLLRLQIVRSLQFEGGGKVDGAVPNDPHPHLTHLAMPRAVGA